jgi:hypothetical protein
VSAEEEGDQGARGGNRQLRHVVECGWRGGADEETADDVEPGGVDGCQRSVEAERESARQVEGKQDRGLLAHRVPITDDRPVITCGALVMD